MFWVYCRELPAVMWDRKTAEWGDNIVCAQSLNEKKILTVTVK